MENNYINTVYNEKERPLSSYPEKLTSYLIKRFDIKKESLLLDTGTGRGDFLNAFQNQGINCIGIDICKNGNEKTYECNFENEKFPFPKNYFDVIFSKSCLEHIHNPDLFISEIYRVLKPDGKLIVLVPDWISCFYLYFSDYTHKQPYTKEAIADLLKIHNFKDIKTEIFIQLPKIWNYPILKIICNFLKLFGAPKKIIKNKFIRFSRERIILGIGIK